MSEENPKMFSIAAWKQSQKECARRRIRLSSPSSTSPPWIELPGDVTANILKRLEVEEILESAQLVCTTWRNVCLDPSMWRVIEMIPPSIKWYEEEYNLMCRCAVERSQGQLTDLRIVCFGDNSLLYYIAHRSSHLRCLTIVLCYKISGTALSEAVKKLPLLEELHLIWMDSVHANDVEAIGISCPMLKSFTYNSEHIYLPFENDPPESIMNEYALAIGKTMPNLRLLRLQKNMMNNEGLEAILDGCPLLELLDIRECFYIDIKWALAKRCSQQIKNLIDTDDFLKDFSGFGFGVEFCIHIRSTLSNILYVGDFAHYDYGSDG